MYMAKTIAKASKPAALFKLIGALVYVFIGLVLWQLTATPASALLQAYVGTGVVGSFLLLVLAVWGLGVPTPEIELWTLMTSVLTGIFLFALTVGISTGLGWSVLAGFLFLFIGSGWDYNRER